MRIRFGFFAASVATALVLAACGSSNGTSGTVSGTVIEGPVNGATVTAYAVTNGTMGAPIGTGKTDANGSFAISVGDHAGPMMLQASGGAYTDEATGTTMTMQPADVMACAIPSVAAGASTTGIQITPLTSMAHARAHHMTGGITDANIAAANAAIGAYFSVSDVLRVVPMNPMTAGSGSSASQDAKNYGMAMAAMSQYAKNIGMPNSSGIVTAMMDDASDGVMDGKMGSSPIPMGGGMASGTPMEANAASSALATAMATFVESPMNRSGVPMADMQALIDRLSGSSGQVPGTGGGMMNGTISATATKGPVAAGTATAYAVANGVMGAQIGSAPTDAYGQFTMSLGAYAGPVVIQVAGGTYVDEATGSTMPMMSGDVLLACVPSVPAGAATGNVQVTPLTSMACARAKSMQGGATDANIGAANAAVGSFFSVNDVLHTMPMDPTAPGSGSGATADARNYGMTMAAMSQYAKTIGMTTSSSGVVTAMMDDASDGTMNGMMGSTAIDMAGMGGMTGGGMMGGSTMMQSKAGTSGLATAMSDFLASTMNRSGVSAADMQSLVTRLASSSGTIQ